MGKHKWRYVVTQGGIGVFVTKDSQEAYAVADEMGGLKEPGISVTKAMYCKGNCGYEHKRKAKRR